MTETNWIIPDRSPGRLYHQASDLVVNEKLDNVDEYIENIATNLKVFLHLETSVRLLMDGPQVQPTTTVISVPFEGDADRIYTNLGAMIFHQMFGYYLSANPKSTHHGITNLVLEGNETSLVRREAEKFLDLVIYRTELAARLMRDYHMAFDLPPLKGDTFFRKTSQGVLDVHLGVNFYTFGEGVERKTIFLPIHGGEAAKDRIYYNLEHIIHQNMVAYDEVHDHYLPVSEELVFRELESVLNRARKKENTRKKIINGLKFHTVLLEDPAMNKHLSIADLYYDKLNRIDLLDEASQRSREMFASALIRSSEITSAAGVKLDDLKLEEKVYIDSPPSREEVTVGAGAAAETQGEEEAAEEEPSTHTNGLTEL